MACRVAGAQKTLAIGVYPEVRLKDARDAREAARHTEIGDVFRYAIATARAENDPTTALRGALVTPTVKTRASMLRRKRLAVCFAPFEDYQVAPETHAALEIGRTDLRAHRRTARL